MRQIVLIAHNLRSAHNVGSLLRTADGLAVDTVFLTGYTPYPAGPNDERLPHLAAKIDRQINKTAIGAQKSVKWRREADIKSVIDELARDGFAVAALEQAPSSIKLPELKPPDKIALAVGREVEGMEPEILELFDYAVEIPMLGAKESFNVAQAAAMALYHLRFTSVN